MFEGMDYIGENVSLSGKPTSIWIDTEKSYQYLPVEDLSKEYDVAIVGGGIVGVMSAYFLSKKGKKVIIIDMHHLLNDVTGHTTAKITSLHGAIYHKLSKFFGLERARLYAAAQEEAKSYISKISELENIECSFERTKAYTFSTNDEGAIEIEKERVALKDIGLPVCEDSDFSLPIEPSDYVCLNNQAQFHPRKFLVGLSKIINLNGCDILEKTKVLQVSESDESVKLTTSAGDITAKKVILASHFPMYDTGKFFTKLEPKRSYVYAVKLKKKVPVGMYYCVNEPYYTFRKVKVGEEYYLLAGGMSHKAGQANEAEQYQALEDFINNHFDVDKIAYHWSTQDNISIDSLPYIGLSPKCKNIYMATGFGGWGMTNGVISGKILSDLVMGKSNKYENLFNPSRKHPLLVTKKFLKQNLNVANNFFGGKKLKSEDFALPTDIQPGSGSIIEYGHEKVASYRDKDGKTKNLSSKCTHMGCTVKWNNAEKTWDCPCHGSRYLANGEVIHGPAIQDLKEKE